MLVAAAPGTADPFQLSFAAGSPDAAGRFAGGTELRLLTAHDGRLFAGNGYWEDRPGSEGPQGLTAVPAPAGRQALLAAVEGSAARLVRIDPRTGAEVTELDLPAFLGQGWACG